MHIYNERLQLIINGNVLSSKSRMERFVFNSSEYGLRNLLQDLIQCDGWVRPWAVRALSGHTVHYDRKEFDGTRPAQVRNFSFVIAGKPDRGRLSCNKLQESTLDRGAWDIPGTSIQEDQYARRDTWRLDSYYGVFAPWDSRNTTTKQRVSGRGNHAMPLAVLYITTVDLVRLQGRITDSSNIIVNRPVPFSLVKEVWFCVPKDNDRRGFELIEKIMDERLEDELVLECQASPILREFRKMKTPARLMQLLCEMPSGPHNAEKEKLLRNFATAVDYHHEDTRHSSSSSHEGGGGLHDQAHVLAT